MNHYSKSSPHQHQDAPQLESFAQATAQLDALVRLEADALMTEVLLKLRVNELAATLRSQTLDREALAMLDTLEGLVLAGEITFAGFILRLQNLFPELFDRIDPQLRGALTAMLAD